MSAFVMGQEPIEKITRLTESIISRGYNLRPETKDLLKKYSGDMHGLYRMLYITNLKAAGRGEKTFPKFRKMEPVTLEHFTVDQLKECCRSLECYLYQIAEDPIYNTPIYYAIEDILKAASMYIVSKECDEAGLKWGY